MGAHGSRPTRDADVDVAVLPLGPIPAGLLASIREALDESHVPFVVDLVDLREAPPALRERAIREGSEWTASTRG